MEYIYGALLLHSAGSEVDEDKLKKVLEGAGVKAEASRVKALVSSLKGVNIDEVVKSAATVPAAPAAPAAPAKHEEKEKKESKKKEEKKEEKEAAASEEDALAGLSSLFG